MIKKQYTAIILLLILILPIKRADAVPVPLLYLAYTAIAGADLTPWLIGSTALFGTVFALVNFKDTSKPESPALQITLDPNIPLITPPEWTATPGQQEPTPPQTSTNMTYRSLNGAITGETQQEYFTKQKALKLSQYGTEGFGYQIVIQDGEFILKWKKITQTSATTSEEREYQEGVQVECKPGYELNAQLQCALDRPEDVQKPNDGLCEMTKAANGIISASKNDPDCNDSQASGEGTTSLTQTSENGSLQINTDSLGNVKITQKVFDTSTNKTQSSTATLNSSRTLTGVATTTNDGNTTDVLDAGTGGGGGTTGGTTFPNDYSRAGEAQTAANSIIQKLDPLTSTTGAVSGSAEMPTFDSGFGSTFVPLLSWRLPPHTSTCPTAKFTVWEHEFDLNTHCQIFDEIKLILSTSMIAVWSIMCIFIVLGS